MENISDIVKAAIQTQILAAFNEGPDLIEKLVKSALSKPVDSISGTSDGYHGNKVPFIDYLIGNTIREATREAVRKVVHEHADVIEKYVREGLSADTVVQAITKAITGTADQDWRINVRFDSEKSR